MNLFQYLTPIFNPQLYAPNIDKVNEMSKKTYIDISSIVIALMPLLSSVFFRDVLYIGYWYYIIVPFAGLGFGILLRNDSYYLLGLSLASTFIFAIYIVLNIYLKQDMLGIYHMLSLPGFLIGIIISAILANRTTKARSVLIIGFLTTFICFLINQIAIVVIAMLYW